MRYQRPEARGGERIGSLFTFALFGVFMLLAILVVVIAADGYRGVVATADSVDEVRTALGYVAGKLRSDAATSGVRMLDADGVTGLILSEEYEGDVYETYIFFRDGTLYEVAFDAGVYGFDPEDGWRLVSVADFSVRKVNDHLVRIAAVAHDGREQAMHVAVRAVEVGGP